MPDYTVLLPILITMLSVICVGGASLLFLRSRNNRSRLILAIIMITWGFLYVARLSGFVMNNQDLYFTQIDVMSLSVLIGGNFYLLVLLLYPIEVIRPGWLNLKRAGIIFIPYILITLFYYLVLLFNGEKPVTLDSTEQFLQHLGEFNVWYRIFMCLSIVVYLIFLSYVTWKYKVLYQQWCNNNYSNDENLNILWLRQYDIGVMLIGIAYFLVLFTGSAYSFMLHNIMVQCFFCYTLYKGLFHENPYNDDFFSDTLDEAEANMVAQQKEVQLLLDISNCTEAELYGNEGKFTNKLSEYRDDIEQWMRLKKPYMNPDFKLMDVAEIVPLNRTYLSRVFNEGFGNSFSEVVRNYRIREAEWLLLNRKDIPVGQIGELCGFSSPSVFNRAFVQSHDGVTPNRFRRQNDVL